MINNIKIIKVLTVLTLLHSVIALYHNVNQLFLTTDIYPYYIYMQNSTIRLIYYFSTIIILVFIISSYFYLFKSEKFINNNILKLVLLLSAIALIGLIWYEIYDGSTFYYGEVRDKHALRGMSNAIGLKGATIYISYVLSLFIFKQNRHLIFKTIIIIVLVILIWIMQNQIYNYFEIPWNMQLSLL